MSAQIRLDDANLPEYLGKMGWIPEGGGLHVESVGDGNINWVRRVRTASGSLVVKQARPALERFPEYQVSTERIVFEARFYEAVAPCDGDRVCPRVLAFDPQQRVLLLEDLGRAERLDHAFARGADATPALRRLAGFLGAVHADTRDPALAARFPNAGMRGLHGDHIFRLPYRENDFPLPPALRRRAEEIWRDAELVERIDRAHARYLEDVGALVHGDVQAGNVLLADAGPKLLDAEIAHFGDPAFDLGTLLAHALLPHAARGRAERAAPALAALWEAYAEAHGLEARIDFAEAALYAGIEVLRRTLGAARVAAVASEEASLAAVDVGLRWVTAPPRTPA